jgi:pimeloyl-ACP methyl ester carboxylesterase
LAIRLSPRARHAAWHAQRVAELERGSRVVDTACGRIEIATAGEGPPVLLSHGSPGGYDQSFYAEPLARAGFSLVAPSRPGYLRTPLATGVRFEDQADAFAALLDALGLENAAIVGASGGGPTAIHFAARHPDRTSALLLECAVTQKYDPHVPAWARALFLSEYGVWLQTRLLERFPRFGIRQLVAQESTFERARVRRTAAVIAADPELMGFATRLLGSLAPYDQRRAGLENDLVQLAAVDVLPFALVTAPTLIAHGSCDGDVPLADAEVAAATIPNAELVTLPDAWHVLPLSEGGTELRQRQIAFLNKHLLSERRP